MSVFGFDGIPIGASNIRCFGSFLSFHYIKFDLFSISNAPDIFSGVIPDDGWLVDEQVITSVISLYEPISIPHIKPLHHPGHIGLENFFLCLILILRDY